MKYRNVILLLFSSLILTACNLTVEPTEGGNVVSSDNLIDCGENCSAEYSGGNIPITLTANPEAGFQFVSFEGPCTVTESYPNACVVTIGGSSGNKLVKAIFEPLPPIEKRQMPIAAGRMFNCAIRNQMMDCWGSNQYNSATPSAELDEPVAVAAGEFHSCAIDKNGLHCWGYNAFQQVDIPELTNVREVSAAAHTSCAISDSGLNCWGNNPQPSAEFLESLDSPSLLALGRNHGCVFDKGLTRCWGSAAPDSLDFGSVTELAVGDDHTCALIEGSVSCFGENQHDQLEIPIGLGNVESISANDDYTCALANGTVTCWGSGSALSVPQGMDNAVAIAAGDSHACALLSTDEINCWGTNYYGESLDSTPLPEILDVVTDESYAGEGLCILMESRTECILGSNLYAPRGPTVPVLDIAIGNEHVCYLERSDDSNIRCTGGDGYGQATPPDINASIIATGDFHSCAQNSENGEILCWGRNQSGALDVPALMTPTSLSMMRDESCVLDQGDIACWGPLYWLGRPPLTNPVVVDVKGNSEVCVIDDAGLKCWTQRGTMSGISMPGAVDVAVSNSHGCATDGQEVQCWGESRWSQLDSPALSNPTRVFAGNDLSCAIDDSGLHCWGMIKIIPNL